MYTVFGSPKTRTFRVIWMLEELGQPYDIVPAMPRSEDAIARNPSGKVPILEVDGVPVTDSVAICTYLADKHGAITHRAGSLARAHQDSVTQFIVDEIEGALWTAAKHRFALPEPLRVPEIKETCRSEFAFGMERLLARLGDKPFATGETFTVPDLLAGHCSVWAANAKFDIPEGPLSAYFARVCARPAFEKAVQVRDSVS